MGNVLYDRFLIACINYVVRGESRPIAQYDITSLDWQYVADQVSIHRLTPVVHAFLHNMPDGEVPAEVRTFFRNGYSAVGFNNFFLAQELLALLTVLREKGIDVVPLKGPVLAEMAYGNIGLREFADIDILIRESDFSKVKALIVGSGYTIFGDADSGGTRFENEHEYCVRRGGRTYKIDIHWRVVEESYGFDCSVSQVLSRSKERNLLGKRLFSLCPEDMLLSIAMHHGKEGWDELRYIADLVGLIVRQKELDWGLVMSRSREMGIEKSVLLGVCLAKRLLSIDIPDLAGLSGIDDPAIRLLSDGVLQKYFTDQRSYTPGDIHFDFGLQQALSPKVNSTFFIKDSLGTLIRPNSLDEQVIKLPARLYFLYYFVRFFRLVKTYGITRIFNSISKLLKAIWMTGFRKISRS